MIEEWNYLHVPLKPVFVKFILLEYLHIAKEGYDHDV